MASKFTLDQKVAYRAGIIFLYTFVLTIYFYRVIEKIGPFFCFQVVWTRG